MLLEEALLANHFEGRDRKLVMGELGAAPGAGGFGFAVGRRSMAMAGSKATPERTNKTGRR